MATILIVEDDVELSDLLRSHLVAEGHAVTQVYAGVDVLSAVEQHLPDLIILDWMLPGMDGLAACRLVRAHYLMPILMLTARTEEIDQVLGLEVGADDYITKPFSIRQLVARVRASLRRVAMEGQRTASLGGSASSGPVTILAQGPLTIDITKRSVHLAGQAIELTPKEYELLVLLMSHPGWVFKRAVILQEVWGDDYEGFERTIDNHITRLRKKLGAIGDRIDTVWGVGYRFNREM
jgi:DNA-binding response OmpR family regulator